MNPGKLNKRITLLRYEDAAADNGLTEQKLVPAIKNKIWAAVEPVNGREYYEEMTLPGFGTWKSAVATISGLVAKENVVATFGQLYHFVGEVAEDGSEIWGELAADFTQVGAYAFMAFNLLCAPCFAAMGAIKREMNNGKWTALAIGYMCVFAYVVSTMIYQFGGLITGELTFGVGTVVAIAFIALIIFLLVRKPAKADSTDGLRRMSVDANN